MGEVFERGKKLASLREMKSTPTVRVTNDDKVIQEATSVLMNDIPDFGEAFEQFRRFLANRGQVNDVFWVFRDDIRKSSPTEMQVRYPPSSENVALAGKVYSEGRERGLIEINALATVRREIAATVWFPKYPHEEIQGWSCGLKLTITEPLPLAKAAGSIRWKLMGFSPSFRRYQRDEFFIGTKAWAAAELGRAAERSTQDSA